MDSFGRYVKQHGMPLAVYTDKHTTYKSPVEPTVDDQLEGRKPQSQFERNLAEMGVKVIHDERRRPKDGWSGCEPPTRNGWTRSCGSQGSRRWRPRTASWRSICGGTRHLERP